MFTPAAVTAIYKSNRAMLDRVLDLEKALIGRFYGMEEAVRCMMLSAMTCVLSPFSMPLETMRAMLSFVACWMLTTRLPPRSLAVLMSSGRCTPRRP